MCGLKKVIWFAGLIRYVETSPIETIQAKEEGEGYDDHEEADGEYEVEDRDK